jgi:hypothetical protein
MADVSERPPGVDRPGFEKPWWLRSYVLEAAIPVVLTEAAAYVVAVGSSPVVRAPLVTIFVLWAPGAALCSLFGPKDRVARTVASVALSLGLLVLTSQTVLSVGAWSSNAVLVTLGALTVATSAAALVRNLARARGDRR